MTISTLGSLVKEDLETRVKNLLKSEIANKDDFLQPLYHSESIYEEINFLFNKGYITPMNGPPFLAYELTSKGRKYAGKE